jgi:hypothetical protein
MKSVRLKTTVEFETPYEWYPYNCAVEVGRYPNGNIRLQLYNHDGLIGTATNQSPEHLGPGEIAVENYGENEGMLSTFIGAGLIEPPHRSIESGYFTIPICRPKRGASRSNQTKPACGQIHCGSTGSGSTTAATAEGYRSRNICGQAILPLQNLLRNQQILSGKNPFRRRSTVAWSPICALWRYCFCP